MKRNYMLLGLFLASAGVMATAQQLPNANFDGSWVECLPDGENVVGTQPDGWNASNVYKMGMKKELITKDADRSNGGDESKSSVAMNNLYVGVWTSLFKMGDTAPGYLTLGKPWAYGDIANVGKPADTSDGGTSGSYSFSFRPDAISLYVKRTHPAEKPSEGDRFNQKEKASVIAYAWNGQTTSKVTTGLSSAPVVEDMVDREKDVLGMTTDGVTKSKDFELVAKSENYIEGDITEWAQKVFPIEYLSESVPSKFNVILASSDYFQRGELGTGNQFWVDDVKLVYYSTLSSLSIAGKTVDLEDGKYDYSVALDAIPAESDIEAALKGKFAEKTIAIDAAAATVTITVTNQGGEDIDGATSHTYTINYQVAEADKGDQYDGKLNVVMSGVPMVTDADQSVFIKKNEDSTSCTFSLFDFSFKSVNMGDIIIENVKITKADDGSLSYAGEKKCLQLGGGAIVADVTLTGTEDVKGNLEMSIPVIWKNGDQDIQIDVTFNGKKAGTSGVASVAGSNVKIYGTAGSVVVSGFDGSVEAYAADGRLVKVAEVSGTAEISLANGLYIVRAGSKVQKVVVK